MRAPATVLGYPRIGSDRRLKREIELFWRSGSSAQAVLSAAAQVRNDNWVAMRDAGIDEVPCNDFSLYDHVLDTAMMFGALPARHLHRVDPRKPDDELDDDTRLRRYFSVARGDNDVAPLEMTKWFDTNYHYLVPELAPDQSLSLNARKPLEELSQARALGLSARPVVLGPLTFLSLSKPVAGAPTGWQPLDLLDELVPLYAGLLAQLALAGAQWVQLDEPIFATDLSPELLEIATRAYETISSVPSRPKLLVATYFGRVGSAIDLLANPAIDGVALDFCGSARTNLDALRARGGLPGKRLLAGVVDGRNVWANPLRESLGLLENLQNLAADVVVSSSCPLLHVPLDVGREQSLEPGIDRWLAFARQKLDEIALLTRGLTGGVDSIESALRENDAAMSQRRSAPITNIVSVRKRLASLSSDDARRATPYPQRARLQADRLALPLLPTTTIGSFPQTQEVRAARAAWRKGELTDTEYDERMRAEIAQVIELQTEVGLDVLVHGEPERADMVQYFADQLDGVLSTDQGWVQSYGTRYVRPPIIVGDVRRPTAMTVRWWQYAQSLTSLPVKAMLTGPVTMLQWSFVRDDQPRADTANQLALAIRDEITDLEAAGAAVIQVDEPALREGLPLRHGDRDEYLAWATRAFRLATSGVAATTQVHTHMCYAEFGQILDAVVALDADVISLEAARSAMSIVDELSDGGYPAAVGPGVYDIHSPRVPDTDEMCRLLRKALQRLPIERVWVNPDCGLKTRSNAEVVPALRNLVAAAHALRAGVDNFSA